MNKTNNKLTTEEINIIKEETNEEFYIKNSENFDNMFMELKKYCEDNYLTIFDKSLCSYELTEFIKNNTKIFNNMYNKNILEEIEYKNDIEEQ
jgi:hypothetical protein